MKTPLFYKAKPLCAVDIGSSTVKVTQLTSRNARASVLGYGYADFDPGAIENGVIVKPELIVKSLRPLLDHIVIGRLTTDRIVSSIPAGHVFTRIVTLPSVENSDLETAIHLEAEQYVPLPADEIYLDYTVISEPTTERPETVAQMVAAPKKIVDSYFGLFDQLDLEVAALEPSLFAITRAINHAEGRDVPRVIIDFGSVSSDLAIYDGAVQLTSTIATGGSHITQKIAETLKVDDKKAQEIKARFGIKKSRWQEQLAPALSPVLSTLASEVQKMLRYHHDQAAFEQPVEEIIIVGGGANLPGLSDFLAHLTGITVTTCNPWEHIAIKPLQPPHPLETTLYTTAVGLALKELEV